MFERYSERARRVVFYARYFTGQAGSLEIETEHLLLGVLREDQGIGNRFLGSPWAAEEIWRKIQQSKRTREKISGPVDIPLSNAGKRVLRLAAEEADLVSSKKICAQHLLLGLLREEQCLAAQILHEQGVRLIETREELLRVPHNESIREEFVREQGPRSKDVAELKSKVESLRQSMEEAIGNHDFAAAKGYSGEEGKERDKLFDLYKQYGLLDWIYG